VDALPGDGRRGDGAGVADSWTQVPGVEGLVIRGSGQRYLPGARALCKVRRRDTTESSLSIVRSVCGIARAESAMMNASLASLASVSASSEWRSAIRRIVSPGR
jgi:hypothetical protein